jgi:hypothetical protein
MTTTEISAKTYRIDQQGFFDALKAAIGFIEKTGYIENLFNVLCAPVEKLLKMPQWLKHLTVIITLSYCALALILSRQLVAQHHQKTRRSIVLKPRLIKPQFSTAPPAI